LVWKIEFAPEAAKELRKLGRVEAGRIIRTLEERIATLDDPRSLGAPLVGEHAGYWRWRIGDYRVVARIEDARVVILVVRVGIDGRFIGEGFRNSVSLF
jgi:mRNA interferase RelE/StbE